MTEGRSVLDLIQDSRFKKSCVDCGNLLPAPPAPNQIRCDTCREVYYTQKLKTFWEKKKATRPKKKAPEV